MQNRFFIESNGIWDNTKGPQQLTWLELCEVLNELAEENEELKNIDDKKEISRLKRSKKRIVNENIRLKKILGSIIISLMKGEDSGTCCVSISSQDYHFLKKVWMDDKLR